MGKRCGASTPSPGAPLFPNPHVFTNLEAFRTSSFWVFTEASLHQHDWLNHWPLEVESASSPSPLPWGRDGIQCSDPLITWLVGSPGNQPLSSGVFLMSPNYHNKRHHGCSHHLGNSKGFRGSVPEMGMKTKYVFLIVNHTITPWKIQITKTATRRDVKEKIWLLPYVLKKLNLELKTSPPRKLQIQLAALAYAITCLRKKSYQFYTSSEDRGGGNTSHLLFMMPAQA